MIILGIDPGVATIGFGAIRADRGKNTLIRYGVITTPPGIPLSSRLLQISNDMEELIHTFHPDEMAVEELFIRFIGQSALFYMQIRGLGTLKLNLSLIHI